MKKIIIGSIALIIAIAIACSVTKKNELDSKVKYFLSEFQNKLNASDEEILKFFQTKQNKDEILKAIAILQNKDTAFVRVKVLFADATASWENVFLKVEVPLEIIGSDKEIHRHKFFMYLFQRDARYYIGKLEAEEMYKQYMTVKNSDEGALARRMADVKVYYDKAKELQKNYDSVIWYVHHKNMTYYYVVNGAFNFDSLERGVKQDYKMGLLDETGRVIVPAEFELIGNPSINLSEGVEVSKNGKIGYYSLDGKKIIDANYEWLVPYNEGGASALVKKDSTFGWLDKNFVFHENFPTEVAERTIKGFEYIAGRTFTFGNGHQEMINILYPLTEDFNRASGLLLAPAYFVNVGLFSRVNGGFISASKYGDLYVYGNEYLEAKSEAPFSISESIKAFVSDFKTRFVGGRGEFYNEHKIVFVDKNMNLVSSVKTSGDYDFEFKRLNEELFESKFRTDNMGPNDIMEQNFPDYNYFKFDGHQLIALIANRRFAFTKFLKIDSSYLAGDFNTWFVIEGKDGAEPRQGNSKFVSVETLQFMRDDILASNGLIFKDSIQMSRFNYREWYKHTTESYDEVYSKASEIDKYNLDFFNKLIGSTPEGKSI